MRKISFYLFLALLFTGKIFYSQPFIQDIEVRMKNKKDAISQITKYRNGEFYSKVEYESISGCIISLKEENRKIVYYYTKNWEIASSKVYNNDNQLEWLREYYYDDNNRLERREIIRISRDNSTYGWKNIYFYDEENRIYLNKFYTKGHDIVSQSSGFLGNVMRYNSVHNWTEKYTYNENNLISFIKRFDSNGKVIRETDLVYDSIGNFIEETVKEKWSPKTYNYTYEKKYYTVSQQVKKQVQQKINQWQKKGKFELLSDYDSRVNQESLDELIKELSQRVIDSLSETLTWTVYSTDYDTETETYKVTFENFGDAFFNIPLNEAKAIESKFQKCKFEIPHFSLVDNRIGLKHIELKYKKKTYTFDDHTQFTFNPSQYNFQFDPIEVKSNQQAPVEKIVPVIVDVDINIPVTNKENSNTYALIIGNEDYTKYQNDLTSEVNVDYARRDAEVFAEYAEKTLGIPKGNITTLTDAIGSQMNREIEKLSKLAKYSDGNATLIFYFAGHGFPDEKTKEAYIMPVDISGTNVKSGIKLNALYSKLTEFPTQKTIVILDACFSGGGRNEGLLAARSVAIKPKENPISGNLLIFSSSSGQQSSLPYDNKQHGMFTYFLLKKLKESKGDVSMEELKDYVTREVQINAVKINNKEQNPKLQVSPNLENVWMDWRLW